MRLGLIRGLRKSWMIQHVRDDAPDKVHSRHIRLQKQINYKYLWNGRKIPGGLVLSPIAAGAHLVQKARIVILSRLGYYILQVLVRAPKLSAPLLPEPLYIISRYHTISNEPFVHLARRSERATTIPRGGQRTDRINHRRIRIFCEMRC